MTPPPQPHVPLRRVLSLPMMTLYGVGTTIGAGIYVLVGKVVGTAGLLAPLSFMLAAVLAAFSALSFAELSARFPRSAGEALYVSEGLRARRLGTAVGLMVVLAGTVSAAAITIGAAGYFETLVAAPRNAVIVGTVALLGALAAWGIREAVAAAALLTVIEIGGLLLIVWVARGAFAAIPETLATQPPVLDWATVVGVASGAILAFYAFIGFEDMVNVAEEVRDVERVLPRAIVYTLVITTLIYVVVALVAAFALPLADVAASDAPLALIYTTATGQSPIPISVISLVAVANGALIQIVMGARVLYGLADQGQFFAVFANVSRRTQTPLVATVVVCGGVLVLALALPLENLARLTSLIVLLVLTLVNLALVALKLRRPVEQRARPNLPVAVPLIGCAISAAFALFQIVEFAARLR